MPDIENGKSGLALNVDNMIPKLLKIILWSILAIGMFFVSFTLLTSTPVRLINIDAIDYAQIAHNYASGDGLTTKFIRPVSFKYYPHFDKHPELTSPPLYSVYLGKVFKLIDFKSLGKPELDSKVILFGSGIFYFLCIPLFFILSSRLLKGKAVFIALFLFLTNIIVLRSSVSGLPDMFLTFVFLVFLITVAFYDGNNLFWPAVMGASLGVCYLTRYSYGVFAVPMLVLCYVKGKNYKPAHCVMFLFAFFAVISPWLIRNYRITGNPFFSLEWFKYKMFTEMIPGNLYWRSMLDDVFNRNINVFFFLRKIAMGIRSNYVEMLSLTGNFIAPFFVVALFYFGFKTKQSRLMWFILLLFAVQFALSSLFRPGASVLFPFLPVVIMIASYFFSEVVDKKDIDPFLKTGVVAAFILINIPPTVFGFLPRLFSEQMGRQPKQYYEENILDLAKMVPEKPVMVSDIPWAVAWYGNITSVWLPWNEGDLSEIKKQVGDIQGAFFSPMLLRYPQEEIKIWLKLYSYMVNYNSLPTDNKFGWDWMNRYRRGDIACFNSSLLKSVQQETQQK